MYTLTEIAKAPNRSTVYVRSLKTLLVLPVMDFRMHFLFSTRFITRIKRQITLMHQYRSRLTTDPISGKLDVREASTRLFQTRQ